jgi:hypothetical protein
MTPTAQVCRPGHQVSSGVQLRLDVLAGAILLTAMLFNVGLEVAALVRRGNGLHDTIPVDLGDDPSVEVWYIVGAIWIVLGAAVALLLARAIRNVNAPSSTDRIEPAGSSEPEPPQNEALAERGTGLAPKSSPEGP